VVLNQPAPSAQLAQVQSVAGTGVVGGLARNDYNLVTPGGLFVSKIIPVGAVLYPGDSLLVQSLNVGVLVTFIVNAWGRDFLAG
jgi:hypothetical protein